MTEEKIHMALCRYIALRYKRALFNSDLSGVPLTKGQAKTASKMRSNAGFPDLMIFDPRGKYHGFFLELKKSGTIVYKQDGSFTIDKHINEQKAVIDRLRAMGYYAEFGIGFDDAKKKVDEYMSLPHNYTT